MDVSTRRHRLEQLIVEGIPAEYVGRVVNMRSARKILAARPDMLETLAAETVWDDLRTALDNYSADLERLNAWAAITYWVDALEELEMAGGDPNRLPGVFDDHGDGLYTDTDPDAYEAMCHAELAAAIDAVASHTLSPTHAAVAA